MPRWPAKKTVAPKTAAPKAMRKPAARRAASAKTKLLQIGDVHIDPAIVMAVEATSAMACRIMTDRFSIQANVPHLAARQAIETRTPLTTWATTEQIFEAQTEQNNRLRQIAEAAEAEPKADEPGPVLQ